MNNTWFTSDLHAGHDRIRLFCPKTRPFSSIEEMDNTLINNWNACVNHEDAVYHLGDFAWRDHRSILSRLKGNIIFIKGNHDKGLLQIFPNLPGLMDINVNGQAIVLCHYPMRRWNKSHHGSWMLHGHCHNDLPDDVETLSTDVGVDRWGCKPVSFEQLKELFSKRHNKLLNNHHKKEE